MTGVKAVSPRRERNRLAVSGRGHGDAARVAADGGDRGHRDGLAERRDEAGRWGLEPDLRCAATPDGGVDVEPATCCGLLVKRGICVNRPEEERLDADARRGGKAAFASAAAPATCGEAMDVPLR